jgi:hypothetical protein
VRAASLCVVSRISVMNTLHVILSDLAIQRRKERIQCKTMKIPR